jgi:FkbM family methyltransferase
LHQQLNNMLPRVNLIKSDQGDFLAFGSDLISNYLFRSGVWEPNLLTFTEFILKDVEGAVVLDIGANMGAFTIPCAKFLSKKNGQLIAFEPQRTIFHQLCGNIFLNRLDNVIAHHKAVGSSSGEISIPIPNYTNFLNVGGFSLEEKFRVLNGTQSSMSLTNEMVSVISLDTLKPPKPVVLIKLDVEGFELEVIKGGINFLKENNYPPIIFEVWNEDWFENERNELLALIESLGYEVIKFGNYDHLAQHKLNSLNINLIIDASGNIKLSK